MSLVRSVPVLPNRLRRPGGQDQHAQRQGMDGTVLLEVELVVESVMSGLELAEQITSGSVVALPPLAANLA